MPVVAAGHHKFHARPLASKTEGGPRVRDEGAIEGRGRFRRGGALQGSLRKTLPMDRGPNQQIPRQDYQTGILFPRNPRYCRIRNF